MEKQKERLVELLKKGSCYSEDDDVCFNKSVNDCIACGKAMLEFEECEKLADHLLANGVIVPLLQTGQTVYRVSNNKMWEVKIWKIEICGKTVSYIDNYDKSFLNKHIGKGVFLTKEEAEQALRKDEGNV